MKEQSNDVVLKEVMEVVPEMDPSHKENTSVEAMVGV